MGMTVGKRTRSCCPISENRSQTSALSRGPGNLFNPTFLCRELSWDGHREKGNEEKGENSYLFLRGKTTFGRNVVPQEAQHFQADPAKCLSMNLRNAFLPCSYLARSAGIFVSFWVILSFFTAQESVYCFHWFSQPVVIQTTIFILSSSPLVFDWAKYLSFPC